VPDPAAGPGEADVRRALARWCSARQGGEPGPTALVVAAHPDDEVIGAGIRLGHVRSVTILHVTDGSPRDGRDASAAGCAGRAMYARLRRRELRAAVGCAGISAGSLRTLDVVDGEAALSLPALSTTLADLLRTLGPEVVVTHPYEGGHPDHDAAAFAVQHACGLLRAAGAAAPVIVEMTSYHAVGGVLRAGAFLPGENEGMSVPLTEADAARKRRMLGCFVTQRQTLAPFAVMAERFRVAPRYDFTRPPHDGDLYYERFRWGPTPGEWRRLAERARQRLGLAGEAATSRS
jgi:LmbE family N-acetylglucosaminyl deacetylase